MSGWVIASNGTRLTKTSVAGGAATPFTRLDSTKGETGQANPVALPDGKTVLYSSGRMGGAPDSRIGVASIADGSTTILDLQGSFPLGVIDGYLVYTTADGTVMAAPFDLGHRRITGPPLALVDQATADRSSGVSYAQMTTDGSLVYVSGVTRRQPVMIGSNGVSIPMGEPGSYSWPRLSPDGKRFAVSVGPL
jgi:Tol biopolymer transport system component